MTLEGEVYFLSVLIHVIIAPPALNTQSYAIWNIFAIHSNLF
jgi:hypothetical protein